jgi:hypothetical protein
MMTMIAPPPSRKPVPPKPIGDPPELSSTLSLRRMSSHRMISHSF